MGLDPIPFMAVTVTALFIHIVSAIAARLLEPVWKNDTFLSRWWGLAQMARLFSVGRAGVRRPMTWGFILTSRVALIVSAVSLGLDLFIN